MTSTMTTVDLTPYRAFWRERERRQFTPEMRAAAEAARREAERLSRILTTEFGARRVYLFGSFAWGPETRPDSDIDLAVEGLPSGQLLSASLRLSNATHYPVDLVPLERLPDPLRNRIVLSGLRLFGDSTDFLPPMSPSPNRLLADMLRSEAHKLGRVQGEAAANRARFSGQPVESTQDLRAIASILADIYQGAENAFQRIARATGEGVPSGPEWHRDLLAQMSSQISGVRPAVLRPATRALLDPFRKFRHLARHRYGFDLEWDDVRDLLEASESTILACLIDLETFCDWLDQTAASET
jgi:predicted nucleotidyltransferase